MKAGDSATYTLGPDDVVPRHSVGDEVAVTVTHVDGNVCDFVAADTKTHSGADLARARVPMSFEPLRGSVSPGAPRSNEEIASFHEKLAALEQVEPQTRLGSTEVEVTDDAPSAETAAAKGKRAS